jgi:hypothetical protein
MPESHELSQRESNIDHVRANHTYTKRMEQLADMLKDEGML